MSADLKTLLQPIHAAGLIIELDGADLLVSPVDRLTEWQCAYLRSHKAAIIKALQNLPANDCQLFEGCEGCEGCVPALRNFRNTATASAAPVAELTHWRDLTAEQLANLWARVKAGEPVQISSNTLSETVWWVRDDEIASALQQQGITEVCYTAAELRALAGKPAEFLKDVHQFKRSFGATLMSASAQPEPAPPRRAAEKAQEADAKPGACPRLRRWCGNILPANLWPATVVR